MVDFQRKGQYIFNELFDQYEQDRDIRSNYLFNVSNLELDLVLRQYDKYLIDKQVCPKCYAYPLAAPDHQNEVVHCHNCGWREA